MDSGLELVRYRDAGMHTYTFFYIFKSKVISPYFDSEKEATDWLDTKMQELKDKR
jgi:hypothetical protein